MANTSNIMKKYTSLKALFPTGSNVYLTSLLDDIKTFPAIVFNPAGQIPEIEFSNFQNRILNYEWDLIIICRKKDYSTFEACIDTAWNLFETLPAALGCKMLPGDPFAHYIKNDEVYAIQMKLKSKI